MEKELSIESRLAKHSTSGISDVLDELKIPSVLPGIFPQRIDQARVVGRALPVRFIRQKDDKAAYRFGGGVGKPLEQVLKTMSAGQVVLMDLDGATDASAWGGLASRLAQLRGVRGTVMWGTCRDVEEIRRVGYPVWAVGTCPRRSRNEFTFGSINEQISIGSVRIAPQDLIVADDTGVVVVPRVREVEVLRMLENVSRQEAVLEDSILNDAITNWDEI